MSKSKVNYNPFATNVTIHNDKDGTDWDVESWMKELSDDPEIVDLLWQILGAIIRPLVSWNKSAWFYSEAGNNGKGTLCELMRSLCGEGSYASIPLSDFGKEFSLEPLITSSAIIVDENDVGTYIDKAANVKAVITGDTISINRKYRCPLAFRFRGFMVQCLNEMPRIKDKSDSFYRRQIFVPFKKCFTGRERKYIKRDYLHRTEVLEYVLKRVLHMDYYELSVPDACVDALEEYKINNDPVYDFLHTLFSMYADSFKSLDTIPCKLLFRMFIDGYCRINNCVASAGGMQQKTFNRRVSDFLMSNDDVPFYYNKGNARVQQYVPKFKEDVDAGIDERLAFYDFTPADNWVALEGGYVIFIPIQRHKYCTGYLTHKYLVDAANLKIAKPRPNN